ncbi:proline-rich receptor-like protein kinase PERK9 [Trifolium pratense]|uniref:proline-rich receptor-like protein kinase PERK9 n=1 Tax=Trifolium pratense TaxID=57577 RepID=UPI001E697D43|nr:proline-rich receptor-like protein kinase PERK9 [Trifolium pratense]
MASHTPFLHQQPTHTHIFNHSQPIAATIPDVENLRSSLNEILEFIEEFRHEMKDSFLDAKKSFQALSDSFKLKTWDKKLPEKIVKKESEKQSAEEVEQLTQPPQQLSPSSVSTPMSTFTSSPWKPPSPSPNLLITQYLPPVPPITLPPSPLNPSPSPKLQPPPKPPEKVFFPFSPFPALSRPPPEPPDLQSTSESILPIPPTSRPPRKPPDRSVPTTLPSQFHSVLDWAKSWQLNTNTGDDNVLNVPPSPPPQHNTVLSPVRDDTTTTRGPESDPRDGRETSVSSDEEDVEVLTKRQTGKRPQLKQETPANNAGQAVTLANSEIAALKQTTESMQDTIKSQWLWPTGKKKLL